MIYAFIINFTEIALVHYRPASLLQVINRKNLTMIEEPKKEINLVGITVIPNALVKKIHLG